MSIDILGYIIMFIVFILCLKIYTDSDTFNLKCIISDVDGKKYCVRERLKLELAADILATATQRMINLVEYMEKNHGDDDRVKRLVANFNPENIRETLPTSKLTAYSENKGEKLAFCLNKKKDGKELIDIETLTFVAIHELGHVMSVEVGHGDEFWTNFKYLLENAEKAGIYKNVDYNKNPETYCGMEITDNPYFDYNE
tara:strand:- start:2784 stop:3380 length:597 start_codon:yes stop_codon:yes gene_type:complete